jgi:hypothetical protein
LRMSARDFGTRPRSISRWHDRLWIALGVAALLVSGVQAFRETRARRHAEAAVADTRAEVDRLEEKARAVREAIWPRDETLASQMLLTAQVPPKAVLAALGDVLPAKVRLLGLRLTYGRRLDVEMEVGARHSQAYDEFLAELGRSPHFAEIVPGAESREGAVQASVRARFRSPL